jgi:hypothetical protein
MATARKCLPVFVGLFVFLLVAPARGNPVTIANVPDFSQKAVAGWTNYCAPTAGADLVYYFAANGHISLIQGFNLAPQAPGDQPATDDGASTIIGGSANQGPPAPLNPVNLANQMGTDANHGTTVNGMLNGLDGYLESEDGVDGSANWNTYLLQSSVVGAAPFWSTLQGELSLGKGILLAIGWKNGAPGGYDTPTDPDYSYDPYPSNPMGHAMMMVGYDVSGQNNNIYVHDPANNNPATSHVWPVVQPDIYAVTVNPLTSDLSINVGGVAIGTIYAAVITSFVPEPGTLALMVSGALIVGVASIIRKRLR